MLVHFAPNLQAEIHVTHKIFDALLVGTRNHAKIKYFANSQQQAILIVFIVYFYDDLFNLIASRLYDENRLWVVASVDWL